MFVRGLAHPTPEDFGANKVGEEAIGQDRGDDKKDRVLEQAYGHKKALLIAFLALRGWAFKPMFDGSEEEFHVDGLWAGPAAPNSPKQGRKQEHGQSEGQHRQPKKKGVCRKKGEAKDGKASCGKVEEKEVFAIPAEVRQDDKDQHQGIGHPFSLCVEFACGEFGVNPTACAVFVHGREDALVRCRGLVAHRSIPFRHRVGWVACPSVGFRKKKGRWRHPNALS